MASGLSGFFIFNAKGEVLISRLYRTDIKRSISDVFRIQVISSTDVRSPITTLGSTSFFHVRHENLYLVAVTKLNANAALIFEFLYKIITLGRSYFGKFDEEAVKNNFTLIYELMDEICDFGYPQTTEPETLKLYITTEGVKSERAEEGAKIAIQATGAVAWRRPDIKYRRNEAFVDVVESVNLLLSQKGTILRADVSGQVLMRAYLSGMPECKFGLNDSLLLDQENKTDRSGFAPSSSGKKGGAVELDDCQFHQCVKLAKFDSDRTISFIPPDGEFELMRYRTTENIHLPFKVQAVVNEISSTRVEFKVAVRSNFPPKLFAQNVVIKIPVPTNTASTRVLVTAGKGKYVGSENSFVWKIARFQGQQEFVFSGEADLTTTTNKKVWSRPPISMDFQVLMFTASGLMVRFLKIFEKSNYQSVKWVRYMTKAGTYQIREMDSTLFKLNNLDWMFRYVRVILADVDGFFVSYIVSQARDLQFSDTTQHKNTELKLDMMGFVDCRLAVTILNAKYSVEFRVFGSLVDEEGIFGNFDEEADENNFQLIRQLKWSKGAKIASRATGAAAQNDALHRRIAPSAIARAYLSTMPECTCGLNARLSLDNEDRTDPGQQEFVFSGEADLTTTENKMVWSQPPLSMDFQMLMFTSSKLMVVEDI
ncbi:hypothetical protein SmJEL517_g05283 [Synchytrium microbalum]|uniref:MHD domain-containing protein n=1 Tax=Synchytrium microbalum TaxID=1806994 RepID=A0A507BWU6_9FUNG|nr:uncharacterized protein SmJEL517_g05283 [Synchytrium microbalum]TPX31349.1 hypothetical protein SmJEL517_g05283 [Synchytrium microbalum]